MRTLRLELFKMDFFSILPTEKVIKFEITCFLTLVSTLVRIRVILESINKIKISASLAIYT